MTRTADRYPLNSFFAGIGGFDLAFERQGFKPSFYCEKNDFCRRVLSHHWPDVFAATDIRELTADDVPAAPVWTAGFPCQDLSLAKVPHGRTGFRGHHSSLFFKFHEILAGHTPHVVLLENVAGLLNSHGGRDFSQLVASLMELGYAVAWRVLNARYFGVPQSRPRVFICAWLGDPARASGSLFEAKRARVQSHERGGFITPSRCDSTGACVPLVSYCISATSGRHTGLDWARSYVSFEHGVRRLTPLECERLQGFPDNWTRVGEPGVTAIDWNDTERYTAVGNAVAIPVVEWIARRIKLRLDRVAMQAVQLEAFGPTVDVGALSSLTQEFRHAVETDFPIEGAFRWKRSGCAFEGRLIQTDASSAPVEPVASRFVDALEKQSVHSRYFLTANAARGILRRVERRNRHLFAPLETSLRRLAGETDHPVTGSRARARRS